jgi:hypothetical protein
MGRCTTRFNAVDPESYLPWSQDNAGPDHFEEFKTTNIGSVR